MIEIKLKVDELVVVETLSRMGIANKREKILYPSCYLFKKDDSPSTYICHFKEIFSSKENGFDNVSKDDLARRDSIIFCLNKWGLIELVHPDSLVDHDKFVFVLPFKDKQDWMIKHKIKVSYG